MGRLQQKIIVWIAIVSIVMLPAAVSASGVHCAFHVEQSVSIEEVSIPVYQEHDQFLQLTAIELAEIDYEVDSMAGENNACDISLITPATLDMDLEQIDEGKHVLKRFEPIYAFTTPDLASEIRPPINS